MSTLPPRYRDGMKSVRRDQHLCCAILRQTINFELPFQTTMINTFHDRNTVVCTAKYGAVRNSFLMAYLEYILFVG